VLFNVGWLFAVYVVFDVTSLKMAMWNWFYMRDVWVCGLRVANNIALLERKFWLLYVIFKFSFTQLSSNWITKVSFRHLATWPCQVNLSL
jgi:hypothetical protein